MLGRSFNLQAKIVKLKLLPDIENVAIKVLVFMIQVFLVALIGNEVFSGRIAGMLLQEKLHGFLLRSIKMFNPAILW